MLTGAVPWPAALARRYRRDGYWTGETLAELLRGPARDRPTHPAVATRADQVGYAELDRRCDALAGGLRAAGARAGDRWVVQLPNSVELVTVCVAMFRLGVIPVLTLTAHRLAEIGSLCASADAAGLVIPDVHLGYDHRTLARAVAAAVPGVRSVVVAGEPAEFTALAELAGADPVDPAPPDPDEVALCLLSGGTTGLPKLIPRTHNDYAYQLRETATAMRLDGSGAYLAALPVAHNAALGCPGVLGALRCGATAVLASSPAPDDAIPLIGRAGVTLTTLMPAFLPLWAASADLFDVDLSRLVIEVGGAMLDEATARAAEQALGCTLTRWFGMGEGLLSFTRVDDPPGVRLGTEGRPLCPADELRVVGEDGRDVAPGAVGELLTRGPYTLRGYYRADEHNTRVFTRDGFFRTGDLVRMTPAGDMIVEGRIRDVINRGGEKVPAGEVEEHLRAHPLVRDAALVAVPDRAMGEKSAAFVIPAGASPPSLAQLRDFLRGRGLAAYKLPDRLALVERFPHTAIGKVDKARLRDEMLVAPAG
ncbi:AMP-binding protein [Solihabitans fulvus]|uniref:AMP-binding protein n=1 Tax=Solihabitans fulvus TaxID=1892852 RepID=A0A5B2XQV7_9PSEU|nr:AMP-binding protein [Solihabitans fulvus]KAA2265796.1 AMP-binding protein [Solihabitans fulvus]